MKKTKILLLCCVLTILIFSSLVCVNANNTNVDISFSGSYVDSVGMSSKSRVLKLTTERIGEYVDEKYTVMHICENGLFSFDTSISDDMPITLEFEEIHNKSFENYAYYVNVDGTDVFLRTGRETSAGPMHFFVKVPDELTKGKTKITVTLRNIGDSPVNICRAWTHSNLEELFKKENIDHKVTVYLFDADISGGYKSKEEMKNYMLTFKEAFGDDEAYKLYNWGLSTELLIMNLSEAEAYRRIDDIVDLSRELDIPFALNMNTWWNGQPGGVLDGKGGFFNDVEYSQLFYDPFNCGNHGTYRLSVPNGWNTSPWPTMNNDVINEIRKERFAKYAKYLNQRLAESRIKCGDKEMPKFTVFMDNEPQYWAYTVFNTSPDSVGDVSLQAVEDFKEKYDVILDPTDGIDEEEERALFYNLNDYAKLIMDAVAEGAGTDYITVNNDQINLPKQQLMDNYYTHQYDENLQGRIKAPWGWNTYETGFTKNGHNGLEGYGGRNLQMMNIYNYTAARGKYAAVNIENGELKAWDIVNDYALGGADFCTVFNARPSDQPKLAASDEKGEEEIDEPFVGREIFTYKFDDESSLQTDDSLIECRDIGISPYRAYYMACPNNDECEGSMTFKVDNGKPLSNGLYVNLLGVVLNGTNPNCYMELYAGSDPDNLQSAYTIKSLGYSGKDYDISEFIDKTKSVAYFKIVIHNVADNRGYSSLKCLSAYEPYAEVLGHTNGFNYSYIETRQNNLLVTLRKDVENMLAEQRAYCSDNEDYKKAEELYQKGRYNSAKKLLLGTASLGKLPAKFMVVDGGKLGDYPIFADVKSDVPVSVILNEIGEKVRFEVSAESDTNVELTFYEKNGKYSLTQEDSEYTLVKNDDGELSAVDGAVRVELTAGRPYVTKPEKKFSGYKSGFWPPLPDDMISVGSTDIETYGQIAGLFFKVAEDVVIKRGKVGAEPDDMVEISYEEFQGLQKGEHLDLTLNDDGIVTAIDCIYSEMRGKVVAIENTKFPEMISPFIEVMDNETQQLYRFKIGTRTEFDSPKISANTFSSFNHSKGIGLNVGDEISVMYMTDRVENQDFYYALKIYDEYITVVDDALDDDTYKDFIYSQNSAGVASLDENHAQVLGLIGKNGGGSVVWKIESNEPIKSVAVKYSGRAILGSNVKILISANGFIYEEIADLETVFAHNFEHMYTANCDDSDIVGGNTVYIKAELDTQKGTTWGFLNAIQVKIKV